MSAGRPMNDSPEDADARIAEFSREVSSTHSVWVLSMNSGFANFNYEDNLIVPMWSAADSATACARAQFPGYQATPLELKDFLQTVLPQLVRLGAWLAVNPTDELTGVQFPASRVTAALFGAAS